MIESKYEKTSEALYVWGENEQFGDGTLIKMSFPTHIGTAKDRSVIASGDEQCDGIKTDNNIVINKILITDLSGKIILQQNQSTTQVNVQSLTKGMYFVQVFSGENKWQSKFLKE